MDEFREIDGLKYKLMPYVYAQAKDSSERGLPMVRALFVEYPNDPGSWMVEDEYLFGSDILVAPLLDANATGRDVYLPVALASRSGATRMSEPNRYSSSTIQEPGSLGYSTNNARTMGSPRSELSLACA